MSEAASLPGLLARLSDTSPEQVFLRFESGDLTYGDFAAATARTAGGLRALGVGRGDLAAVMLPNCREFALALFGLMWLGAVEAPINTAFRGPGLARALRTAGARVLVIDDGFADAFAAVAADVPDVETLVVHGDAGKVAELLPQLTVVPFAEVEAGPSAERARVADDGLAMLLYTSGSTGPSKACMLPHRFLVRHAELFCEHLELRPDDVLYSPFPLFHADATVFTVAPALVLGCTAALGERFSVRGFWPEVRAFGATVFDFMGATLTLLMKQAPGPDDADNPARLGWGVPMPEFADDFERRFDLKLVEVYGLTDAGIPVYHPLDAPRRGSCGRPVPPFEVRLVDEDGEQVPTGEVGEIAIHSNEPSLLLQGYFGMRDATRAALRDGWFRTGDLARADDEGYLYFVGRRKEVVRRRGENISVFEVEEVLEAHPAVLEAAVFGLPSEFTEEDVAAAVVLRPGGELTPEELLSFGEGRMARYMLPRYVEFVPSLPRTPTEKLEKFRLVERGVTAAMWDREAQP